MTSGAYLWSIPLILLRIFLKERFTFACSFLYSTVSVFCQIGKNKLFLVKISPITIINIWTAWRWGRKTVRLNEQLWDLETESGLRVLENILSINILELLLTLVGFRMCGKSIEVRESVISWCIIIMLQ